MQLLDQDVRQIVTGALAKIRARGETGECDLVRDLAVPVPVTVIGRMMGSVDEDIDKLLTWTQELQEGMTYARDTTATLMQMAEYYMSLVSSSRIPGVENLVRSIRLTEIDGRKLNDEEIALYLGMLLYAGNQPTRDAISSGLLALIRHPNLLKPLPIRRGAGCVGRDPALDQPGVLLRPHRHHGHHHRRRADQDRRPGGHVVRLGQPRPRGHPRPGHLRHHPRRELAHPLRLRRRWPTPLPRRLPRA